MSRGCMGPARKAVRPASIAQAEGARHRDRIARLGDGGIEQHAVVAELHRGRRMRRQADASVDDQRNLGKMRAHGPQAEHIVEPFAGADRRAPRHQHFASGFDKPLGDDEILGRIREDFEAVGGKNPRRLDEPKHVGLQRVGFADDFELDPGRRRTLRAPSQPSSPPLSRCSSRRCWAARGRRCRE